MLHAFTTRADTIMGVTFCAVAAEHPLAAHAAQAMRRSLHSSRSASAGPAIEAELATQEKKGMPTGLSVRHPLTGDVGARLGRQLCAHELRRRRGHGRAGAR